MLGLLVSSLGFRVQDLRFMLGLLVAYAGDIISWKSPD